MRRLLPLLLLPATLPAHYTWVAASPPAAGAITVTVAHGHRFPTSEEAINARQVELFALTPAGERRKLSPVSNGKSLTAAYTVTGTAPFRIVMSQDRGITSRTPAGVKPGGRDQNPNASQASRTYRSAVACLGASSHHCALPIGLEFELTGEFINGVWNLQLLRDGKPAAGVAVEVFPAGAAKPVEAGKTATDGRLTYRPPAGAPRILLFAVSTRASAPQGAAYDFTNYEASLSVGW